MGVDEVYAERAERLGNIDRLGNREADGRKLEVLRKVRERIRVW